MWKYAWVQLQRLWRWFTQGTVWTEQVPFVVEWGDVIVYRGVCDLGLQYMQIDVFTGRRRKYVVVARSTGQMKLGVLRFYLSEIKEVYR